MDCLYKNKKTGECVHGSYLGEQCTDILRNRCKAYDPESDDDQTIKADAGKAKLTLVPTQIIFDIARVREYGLKKYGTSESWKSVDIQRYRDATYRHFLAYLNDPSGVDEESGLPHLWHMACNIAFLCEMEHKSLNTNDISRKEGSI